MLKSGSEKDRVDVAGLGNDFWNLLSNDLDKDTLFSSSVLTLSIHLNFCLTSNSQNSNSHENNFLPCLCGEEFVHLCRQWPDLDYSCLHYILAELQPMIHLAQSLQYLETPSNSRCILYYYQGKLLPSATSSVVYFCFLHPTHPILVPHIHYWFQFQLLVLLIAQWDGSRLSGKRKLNQISRKQDSGWQLLFTRELPKVR